MYYQSTKIGAQTSLYPLNRLPVTVGYSVHDESMMRCDEAEHVSEGAA